MKKDLKKEKKIDIQYDCNWRPKPASSVSLSVVAIESKHKMQKKACIFGLQKQLAKHLIHT